MKIFIRYFFGAAVVIFLYTIFFFNAFAETSIKYDLENLRNQNANFVKAYDVIHVQDMWEKIFTSSSSLSSIIIGIVDSGIDAQHKEFNDPFVDLGSFHRSMLRDLLSPSGHGTQVAGIIGGNNFSRTSILPVNSPQMNGILSGVLREDQYVLDIKPYGGPPGITTNTAISVFASLEATLRQNPQVLNMSFGHTLCSSLTLLQKLVLKNNCITTTEEFESISGIYNKIVSSQASKTLFVASAGNDDFSTSFTLPAGLELPNMVVVGATNLNDERAVFNPLEKSNFGLSVDIAAPGINVYAPKSGDGYDQNFGGTSASAPMVTGVAGLLKAVKPDLTPAQMKDILIRSADPITTTDASELTKTLGSGCVSGTPPPGFRGCRLNALKAVCLLLNCATPATTGTIHGIVRLRPDDGGGIVSNANIELVDANTFEIVASATSDNSGSYSSSAPAGDYLLEVFKPIGDCSIFTEVPVTVTSGQTLVQDVVAQLACIS